MDLNCSLERQHSGLLSLPVYDPQADSLCPQNFLNTEDLKPQMLQDTLTYDHEMSASTQPSYKVPIPLQDAGKGIMLVNSK